MADGHDLPLFAWNEALRARRRRRHRLHRRSALLSCFVGCVLATTAAPPFPRLVWNASASAPIGLYSIDSSASLARGDMVVARTPDSVRDLAARRHYLPANVPLVKRVAGVAGDRICSLGERVTRNARLLAMRQRADRQRRALPWWSGCTTLDSGHVFLLMTDAPDSFDGRYFGPTPTGAIVGKATLLWRR